MTLIDITTLFALIPWTLYLLYFGVFELHKILGGSFILFVSYPFIIFVQIKYKEYRASFWILILTLVGLTAVNHMYYYLSVHPLHLGLEGFVIFYGAILGTILVLVNSGYLGSCDGFVKWDNRLNNVAYNKYVKFCGTFGALCWAIAVLILPFIWSHADKYTLSIKTGIGCIIVFGTIMLITTNNVETYELEYFAKPIKRIELGIDKAKKYLYIGIIIVVLNSVLMEMSRRQWLLWGETMTALVMHILLQFRFSNIVFLPRPVNIIDPGTYHLPTLQNKNATAVALLALLLYIVMLIIML